MSGSDIAPFVAATIRDKVVTEMGKEIEQLRADLEKAKRAVRSAALSNVITITGKGGTPIYAKGSLNDSEEDDISVDADGNTIVTRYLRLTNSNTDQSLTMCPVREIESAEVRRGGELICVLGEFKERACLAREYYELYYGFKCDGVSWDNPQVVVHYGPIPEELRTRLVEPHPLMHQNEDIAEVKFAVIGLYC